MTAMARKSKPKPPDRELTEAEKARLVAFSERQMASRNARGNVRIQVTKTAERNVAVGPADGEDPLVWQADFMATFGTTDQAVAERLFTLLLNASTTVETTTDAKYTGLVANVAELEPRNSAEAMLACQMVATHEATMELLARMRAAETAPQFQDAGSLAAKFLRIFGTQVEQLHRLRRGPEQRIVVQHVHVHADQAAVQVNAAGEVGGGGVEKTEERGHAPSRPAALPHEPGAEVWRDNQVGDAMPVPRGKGSEAL